MPFKREDRKKNKVEINSEKNYYSNTVICTICVLLCSAAPAVETNSYPHTFDAELNCVSFCSY